MPKRIYRRRKRGPPPLHDARMADRRSSDPKSSGAAESQGERGKGETPEVVESARHDKLDEAIVAAYVVATLMQMATPGLLTELPLLANVGVQLEHMHAIGEVVGDIRERLFFVHAYIAFKSVWRMMKRKRR